MTRSNNEFLSHFIRGNVEKIKVLKVSFNILVDKFRKLEMRIDSSA